MKPFDCKTTDYHMEQESFARDFHAEDYHHCPVCGNRSDIWDVISSLVTLVGKMKERQFADELEQPYCERPFDEADLIDAIECYATAVSYGDQFLVWIPMDKLNDFLHPLLDEALENNDLRVVLDSDSAMIDLTEICDVYGLDMGIIYDDCEI